LRGLVRETRLDPADFVLPMFVAHGLDRREPISAMPGVDRLSIAHAVAEAGQAAELGPRMRRARGPGTTKESSSSPPGRSRRRIPICS
jgi:delta-aminolevulinic acid dehydratase/porphobilinogen synthase